jgi:Tol biopolymer transport system component
MKAACRLSLVALSGFFLFAFACVLTAPSQSSGPSYRIAFVRVHTQATNTIQRRSWLFTMDSDGKNIRELKIEGFDPCWSADGKRIAFASSRDETEPEVYVVNADGSGLVRVTREKGGSHAAHPVWSPDGKLIAFHRWLGKTPEVFVVNVDGGEAKQLTSGGGVDPSWSPDGKRIAFASARAGSIQLFSVNLDGGGLTKLTAEKPGATEPAWSPDGTKILFTVPGDIDRASIVGILDVSSGKTARFAYSDKFSFFSPAWSPDGKTVLLELSGHTGVGLVGPSPYLPPRDLTLGLKHQVFSIGVDGSNSRQLTKADDGGGSPAAGRTP